jgi:hypothetical protein
MRTFPAWVSSEKAFRGAGVDGPWVELSCEANVVVEGEGILISRASSMWLLCMLFHWGGGDIPRAGGGRGDSSPNGPGVISRNGKIADVVVVVVGLASRGVSRLPRVRLVVLGDSRGPRDL